MLCLYFFVTTVQIQCPRLYINQALFLIYFFKISIFFSFVLLIFLSVTVEKSKLLCLDKSLRNFTLPFLHNSPWQIPFLNWRFRQFNFLYHSSYELCHYNVCLGMSPTSICIFFVSPLWVCLLQKNCGMR